MDTLLKRSRTSLLLLLAFACLMNENLIGQTTTHLTFNQNVQATDGVDPLGTPLGPYYSGSVIDYTNVGQLSGTFIDARITATPFGNGYSLIGHLPNYSQNVVGQPTGDAGIVYAANQAGEAGGLTWKMDFYVHGSNWLTPFVIPQARILIYDVDGESIQSEAFRAFKSDGLMSYQLGNTAQALVATDNGSDVLFQGPGTNFSETDPTGAAILLYQNTNSITLQFEAFTDISSTVPNPIFSGIDGDLSILNGDESGFNPPVEAPEPSSAMLAVLPIACAILTRRRRLVKSRA